jgi:hypothetical protein
MVDTTRRLSNNNVPTIGPEDNRQTSESGGGNTFNVGATTILGYDNEGDKREGGKDNDDGWRGSSGKGSSRGPLDDTSSDNEDWSGAEKFLGNACKKRDKIIAPAAKDDAHNNWNNEDSDDTVPIAASQAQGVARRTRVESAEDDNEDSHDDDDGDNNDNEANRQSLIAAGRGKATGLSEYSDENSGYGAEESAKGTIKNDTHSRKEQLEALTRNHGERARANFGSAAAVESQKGSTRGTLFRCTGLMFVPVHDGVKSVPWFKGNHECGWKAPKLLQGEPDGRPTLELVQILA